MYYRIPGGSVLGSGGGDVGVPASAYTPRGAALGAARGRDAVGSYDCCSSAASAVNT